RMRQLFALVVATCALLVAPIAAMAQSTPGGPEAVPGAGVSSSLLGQPTLLGQAGPTPEAPAPAGLPVVTGASATGDASYVLGMGDTVEVAVLGRQEFNVKARIGSDGAIVLPL